MLITHYLHRNSQHPLLASLGVFTGILSFLAAFNTSNIVVISGPIPKQVKDVATGNGLGISAIFLTLIIVGVLAFAGRVLNISVLPEFIIEKTKNEDDRFEKWSLLACIVNFILVYFTVFFIGLVAAYNRGRTKRR